MDKTELRKFVSLFDAWHDAVKLAIQWQKIMKDSLLTGKIKSDWAGVSSKENIEKHLSSIKSYVLTPLLDEIETNLLDSKFEDRENYIRSILVEFTPLSKYFSPLTIDESNAIPKLQIVQGKNIVNMIWENYWRKGRKPSDYLSRYIVSCCSLLWDFIERLDILCIGLKIDIQYIQCKYRIWIREERNYDQLEAYGFSYAYVREIEDLFIKTDSQQQETNKSTKKKEYKSFEDIFVSKDAYAKAISWLEDKNYFVNGNFVLDKKRFPELFRALKLKGYLVVSLSARDREAVSKLIHDEGYGKSQFADANIKTIDMDIMERKISQFSDLPKYILKSDKSDTVLSVPK